MTGGIDGDPTPPAAFRCAIAARYRGDPQLGSAPPARRWLLLEHRGPWQIDALAGSGIAPRVLDALIRTAAAEEARPLLIRRPGRTSADPSRTWAVTYQQGLTYWGTWRADEDLLAAVDALSSPLPGAGATQDPVVLVCTHGVHDACCAIRGRPVAAALAAEFPAATWECTHVGGDRFAPNVVLLPDNVYYGLLDPDAAVEAVHTHLRGQLKLTHLRGITSVPPPAQVAIAAVHERFGPLSPRDVEVAGIVPTAAGAWQIELTAPAAGLGSVRVTVVSGRRAPAQLTCRAGTATPATGYHVVEVQVASRP